MPPGRGLGGAWKKRETDVPKILSESGKTPHQHLQELKEKIVNKGGIDVIQNGWTCKLEQVHDNGGDHSRYIAVYVSPTGKKFQSRKEVEKELGLKSDRTTQDLERGHSRSEKEVKVEKRVAPQLSRDEAYQKAREEFKKQSETLSFPIKIPLEGGILTVNNFGKIVSERDSFHNSRYLWPMGYLSIWKENDDEHFESEVLDGATVGKLDIGEIDGPVFMVTIKRAGKKPEEVFGKSPKEAWRKALKDDKADERFGFGIELIKKRIEGLKNSKHCENYVFLAMRQPKTDDRRGRDTDRDKGRDKSKSTLHKIPAKRTSKNGRIHSKSRDFETKRSKEDAATKKKHAAEEALRKKREQHEEERWNSRFPIEDMALEVEAKAISQAEERGHDVRSQRLAAVAVVEAIERGLCKRAALHGAKKALATVGDGGEAAEVTELALEFALEWQSAHMRDEDADENKESACFVDDDSEFRVGARVRMTFAVQGEGSEEALVPYEGLIIEQPSGDSDKHVLSFRSESNLQIEEVRLPDPDVQLLPPDSVRLPSRAPRPSRAAYYAADLLGLMTFLESFRGELDLPKVGLKDLVDSLAAPWSGSLLGDLYQALLAACAQVAEQQGVLVPAQWFADTSLTAATWPEVLRRWILFGPRKDLHQAMAEEAFGYYSGMLDRGVGGSGLSAEGHLALLTCLAEDVVEHEDVKRVLDRRLEAADEARRDLVQAQKELQEEEKRRKEVEATVEQDDEEEGRPGSPMVPEDLIRQRKAPDDEADRLRRIEGVREKEKEEAESRRAHERLLKREADLQHKMDRAVVRAGPVGQDRFRNRYWWFPADRAALYLEPPPGAGARRRDWLVYDQTQARELLAALDTNGVREAELARELHKVVEDRMPRTHDPAAHPATALDPHCIRLAVAAGGARGDETDLMSAMQEALAFAHQECKNMGEAMAAEHRAGLPGGYDAWFRRLSSAGQTADCRELTGLLLEAEEAVAAVSRPQRARPAPNGRADHPPPPAHLPHTQAACGSGDSAGLGNPCGRRCDDAAARADDAGGRAAAGGGWRRSGSEYIGAQVRRAVLGDDGLPAGLANGRVIGWLDHHESDFVSKETSLPAALWRIAFDDEDIGEEDLELKEVVFAMEEYKALEQALAKSADRSHGGRHAAANKRPTGLDDAAPSHGSCMGGNCKADRAGEDGAAEAEGRSFDEGAVDMFEAANKPSRKSLWTSSLQRKYWRLECDRAGRMGSVSRVAYSAAVLCDHVLRVANRTRDSLSSWARTRRVTRNKRSREVEALLEAAGGAAFTESGRKVKKVHYAEKSDSEDLE